MKRVVSQPSEIEVLNVSVPARAQSGIASEARLERPSSQTRALTALAALALGSFLAMTLLGRSADEGSEAEDQAPPTHLRERTTTTTAAAAAAAAKPQRTTITFPPAEHATEITLIPPEVLGEALGDLPLGEEVGLWLFIGGDTPLQRFDLDTGGYDRFGIRAEPLLATGGELVIATAGRGQVGWASLSNPGEEADGWLDAEVAAHPDPGSIWFRRVTDPGRWTAFSLETGRALAERAVDPNALGRYDGIRLQPSLGPDLITTANGIYRALPNGERRWLTEGRLVASGNGVSLVEVAGDGCVEQLLPCPLHWVDSATGGALEFPSPKVPLTAGRIVGDGRWLVADHPVPEAEAGGGAATRAQVISVRTGEVAAVAYSARAVAVSPDGRWLGLLHPGGNLELRDLEDGTSIATVDLGSSSFTNGLLFVAKR